MLEPTRLFDCIELHLKDAPHRTMLAGKKNHTWKKYSTVEVSEIVNKLSSGLLYAGIGPGDFTINGRDKVAVISKNCPEWVILDLAVQQIGAVLIPIYPTVSDIDLEFILKDAGVKMIFVNKYLYVTTYLKFILIHSSRLSIPGNSFWSACMSFTQQASLLLTQRNIFVRSLPITKRVMNIGSC